jgi:hypothetical protein
VDAHAEHLPLSDGEGLLVCAHAQGLRGSVADIMASLPGTSEGEKLSAAVEALVRAQAEASDMRARNRALAEDLFRLTAAGQCGVVQACDSQLHTVWDCRDILVPCWCVQNPCK